MKKELKNDLKSFAKIKLANHLNIPESFIVPIKLGSYQTFSGYSFRGLQYAVRFASPALINKNRNKMIWDFSMNSTHYEEGKLKRKVKSPVYDYYILIGLIDEQPEKVFLVPAIATPSSHVRISIKGRSKYQNYEI